MTTSDIEKIIDDELERIKNEYVKISSDFKIYNYSYQELLQAKGAIEELILLKNKLGEINERICN